MSELTNMDKDEIIASLESKLALAHAEVLKLQTEREQHQTGLVALLRRCPMRRFGKPWPKYHRKDREYTDTLYVQTILHLHQIEANLRKEIEREQIYHWTPEMIKARFG